MYPTTKNTVSQQISSDLADIRSWRFGQCPSCGEMAPAGSLREPSGLEGIEGVDSYCPSCWSPTGNTYGRSREQIEKELDEAIAARDAAMEQLEDILEEEMKNAEIRVALLEAGMESLMKRVKQLENENSELRDCLGEEWKK